MNTYLRRAIKYYLYIMVMLVVIIAALVILKLVDSDMSQIFRNGWDSYWQIALMLLFFAAIYPKFGYSHRSVVIPGSFDEIRPQIIKVMENRGYELERLEGENMTFRYASHLTRFMRTYEDRLTFTREMTGYDIEGMSKDLTRVVASLRELNR